MATPKEIVAFLKSETCRNITEAQPVTVTVDGQTFPAARYTTRHEYTSGMDAVTRGHKKAGEVYYQEAVYVAGPLPKLKAEGRNVAFTVPGEDNEWYVASHNGPVSKTEHNPFGRFYILMPWNLPNKIDSYETRPYRRVELRIGQEA
jgi:hypothetical protein